jgi:hypothetical protein
MDRNNPSIRACYVCGEAPDTPWPAPELCANHTDAGAVAGEREFKLRRTLRNVDDSKTAKDVLLTDQERIWLAGLLGDHIQRMGEEHPNNANEVAEVMRDIAWGVKLKRRLWEGVEL